MLFLDRLPEAVQITYGVWTVIIVIGVLMHGYRNDVLAWPYAIIMLFVGPWPVFAYIIHVLIVFNRDDVWAEKKSGLHKYDSSRFPSNWEGTVKKPEKPKDPSRKKAPTAESEEEFDGYESPPNWDI